jgi:Cupin-like domain
VAGFANLLAPISVHDFLQKHWPGRAYTQATGTSISELTKEIPELVGAERVLEAFEHPVSLLRKNGPHASVPTGRDAIPALHTGFTCYLRRVERALLPLQDLLDDACQWLGLPTGSMTSEVFCSTGESGVAMHSDFDVNFAFLLSGRKQWKLAENTSIVNQTSMCFAGDRVQPDPAQLVYADAPFPTGMPAGATEVTIEDGGFVFVPRGWWHETFSFGSCLQLNLVVKGPYWVSVLTSALKQRLLEDPGWRGYAYGIAGKGTQREQAIDTFAGLLTNLRNTLLTEDPPALAERLLAGLDADSLSTGSTRQSTQRANR